MPNVVLGHHTVENIMVILHIRTVDGNVGVVKQLLVEQYPLGGLVKDGSSIHAGGILLVHRLGLGPGPVDAFVVALSELGAEEFSEHVGGDFLETEYVGVPVAYLLDDPFFSVIPRESAGGRVPVQR